MENKELVKSLKYRMNISGLDVSSIKIEREYIGMCLHTVFKIGDIDILLDNDYLIKFRRYVDHWGLDMEQYLLVVILRAFRVAIGQPDEGSKDLPIHLGMKFHVLENILVGIKIRRELKSNQLDLFDYKKYQTSELVGKSELIKTWI